MEQGRREVWCHGDLGIEAYCLLGVAQPFPNHFHEKYVIGLVEKGTRILQCGGETLLLSPGDIMALGPGENHGCTRRGEDAMDYLGLQIPAEAMAAIWGGAAGAGISLRFAGRVTHDGRTSRLFKQAYALICGGAPGFAVEEALLQLAQPLLARESRPEEQAGENNAVEAACCLMRERFAEPLSLAEICAGCHSSKSSLLRGFVKSMGITPYRYLQSLRIERARGLLQSGVTVSETALCAGFSDQSHFTHAFRSFTGLSPAQYRNIFLHRSQGKGRQ